jgi:hypothetical protein
MVTHLVKRSFEMSYDKVSIANSTGYSISGKVSYRSAFCSNDDYSVGNGKTWTASSRGICLLTKITATVDTPNGNVDAKSYTSAGTTYARFAVVAADGGYEVTRLTGADEDEQPSDYVEPTEQQK